MARKEPIYALLDTVGDGSGTKEAIGDYSVTPGSFRFNNGGSGWGLIARMIIMIEDTGSFDSGLYGNGVELTEGIRVYHKDTDDNIIEEYTSFPILSNGDWAGHCYDYAHFSYGSGNEVAAIRWTFTKAGQPIEVHFDQGEYFEVYLNDDFSNLVKHRFTIHGKMATQTE